MPGSADPTAINAIAVDAEDVVTALEAGRRSGQDPVLRVTPPFSGRMRARIHRDGATDYEDEPAPIHVEPDAFVTESAPAYPTPAETEDALRTDPTVEYTRERHRERHAEAVANWREAVTDHFADTVTLDTPSEPHEVSVSVLG
ncbi:hypothetical protein [Halorientalis regularis]|jgi:hypothetical protein|uniref:DUF8009 domain-containing protein n=1 Tax=Halorientalis regularis TaxID=660518 RepID=A0A1G7M3U5_9EURY|nr:hypothetical protein [Halorientalis regularis]SDF56321.1 hypothetical protein SAMN05216218_107121 [Halorientalis regularis]